MQILDQIIQTIGVYSPNIMAALVILIVGWLVAIVVSSLAGRALRKINLDYRLAKWIAGVEEPEPIEASHKIAKGIYYLILIFVLVAFLDVLGLTIITEPLNRLLTELSVFAPRLIGAGILLVIAWILATIFRRIVLALLSSAKFDERLGAEAGYEKEAVSTSQTISNTVYWLVLLLFIPAILDALALQGLMEPVQEMINKILSFLPNIFAAALILVVGWFIARIIQRIVTNLLAAIGTDRLSEKTGLSKALGEHRLSDVLGLVIYILILIPVLIAAINALQLEAITGPASNMLNLILSSLPMIFAAALVLAISYVIGRLAAKLTTNLLDGIGFNSILARLGIGKEPAEGERTPSEIVGNLVLLAFMLFAAIEASNLLGFTLVADLVYEFTIFAGHVILGLIIFAIGIYLANLASKIIKTSDVMQAGLLAMAAQIFILFLAGAMALRQMGIANEIINLAFGLLLGAMAVALALAFGLGGREIAASQLEEWRQSIRSGKS